MQTPAYRLAQYHAEDFHRAAAAGVRRAEARRTAAERLNHRRTDREIVLTTSPFRRLAARFAL
jgi:hypothetical protein